MYEDEYEDYDSIPEGGRHLYREVDGKWVLIKASEIKTAEDIARLQEGLRKEREAHKETKKNLQKYNGMDAEEIQEKLDRIEELELAAGGKLDDESINKMVEARLKSKTSPLQRQIDTLLAEKEELSGTVTEYQTKEKRRTIHDHIRKAVTGAKVRDTAIDDALMIGEHVFDVDESGNVVTKDNVGVTPGITPEVWLTEVKDAKPHWWPDSQGVGARGSQGGPSVGNNPFSAEGWNLTEQGKLVRENRSKAEQLAKSAGTTIGGGRPVKK